MRFHCFNVAMRTPFYVILYDQSGMTYFHDFQGVSLQSLFSNAILCNIYPNLWLLWHDIFIITFYCFELLRRWIWTNKVYHLSLWHVCVSIWYYYQIGEWWSSLLLRDTKLSIIRAHWGGSCLCDMFMSWIMDHEAMYNGVLIWFVNIWCHMYFHLSSKWNLLWIIAKR